MKNLDSPCIQTAFLVFSVALFRSLLKYMNSRNNRTTKIKPSLTKSHFQLSHMCLCDALIELPLSEIVLLVLNVLPFKQATLKLALHVQ